MDSKKIAFSFGSKQVKKPLLAPVANSFERKKVEIKKELIGSIQGDSFDVLNAPKLEEVKELIIPLPPQSSISDKIAQLVDTKRKLRTIGNIPVQPQPENETIEQRAAREIQEDLRRQDLVAAESADNGRVVKPLNPDELPLDGGVEPSQDDYDNMPVDNFGLAMLRGMGFKGELKKVGLDVEDAPMARPKGMGLGVDRARLAQQANTTITTKDGDEKLELKKNAFAKVISGKLSGSYGVMDGESSNDSQSHDESNSSISLKLSNNVYKLCRKRTNMRSVVWDVFFPIQDDNGAVIPHFYGCKFCKKVVRHASKTTTSLLTHDCVKKLNAPSTSSNRVQIGAEERKEAVLAFTKFVVMDSQPFQIVDGTGFRELIKFAINMGHKYGKDIDLEDFIPHRTTLSRNVEKMKEKHDEALRTELKEHTQAGYSLTSDLWKDKHNNEHFLGLTICYSKDQKLVNCALAVKSMDHVSCTAEHIADKTLVILKDFGLDETFIENAVMVTDRGSNMITAVERMGIDHLNCASHLLNTTLSSAIEAADEPITSMLDTCRSLVLFMKKAAQQYLFDTSLESFCPNRWYSCYFMCNSVLVNHALLTKTVTLTHKPVSLMAKIDYQLLSQLTALLGIFKETSEILGALKTPTIHLVYPALSHLESACEPKDAELQAIANFKSDVLKRIKEKFRANISTIHRAAVLLNPLSNQLRSLTDAEAADAIGFVKEEMKRMERESSENSAAIKRVSHTTNYQNLLEFSTAPRIGHEQGFPEKFLAGYVVSPSTSETFESVEDELNRYKQRMFYIPKGQNPLSFDTLAFWHRQQNEYPRLAPVARKIFVIPATSAASERIFSKARNLISDYRSRLAVENINDLLTMSANGNQIDWDN